MTEGAPAPTVQGSVLVLGGGIAGIQASLDLADQGYRVYLVEGKSAIGGHMAQLDKTFPTNDCAMCTLSPKLVDAGRHLNIELLVDTEVLSVEGEVGDFTVTLRRKPRYIDVEKCVGCGDCADVCPVVLLDTFNEGISQRKAAHVLYPQAVPSAYAIEKKGIAPCRAACPAGQRAQGYIALIAEGRYREAFRVIKEDNPFPSVCGRTCHHPCEGHCARAFADDAVGIMSLKRFVMDHALAYGRERVEPAPRTRPEWVAVVGAGPAGLTAAHDLAKMGYGVTVFEALPVAGGMMRVGIPAHRLPKGVLQQDIDDILDLGIVLKTNSPIENPEELLQQGYNAVCLATGISTRDHSLGLEGEDAEGVISAATFLRKINLGEPISVGTRIAVVGGGITALDAAAIARRLGAEEVYLALDRPRGELPAYHWEVAAVESEGIRLLEHTTATRILTNDGAVTGIEFARTGKGMTVDEQGRRRPRIEEGTEFVIEVDTVIGTVGQQSDLNFLHDKYDELKADPKTLASEIHGLFLVGGRKTGASYIIEAVALGHRVARSIDRYLRFEPLDEAIEEPPAVKVSRDEIAMRVREGEIELQPRSEPALLPMEERVTSFREVVLGLTEHQARAEARRCLQCGLCAECLACVEACGTDAIDHNMVEKNEELHVGAVILAPGYQTYQAEFSQEYGLGRYPNVLTSLQLERLLNASGPTQGHVQRPSDGETPRKVAFLQCVGSRDTSHDYCSAICCMSATKEAILIRDHCPDTEVQVFMMDTRAFSKGYEAYYRRAQSEYDIKYTRCRISGVREDPKTNNLVLRYSDNQATGQSTVSNLQSPLVEDTFDMVILSVGMEISPAVRHFGESLGIELDEYGFCHTLSFAPVESSRSGIYAVGPFREPKDIPESVIDASAAAGMASTRLSVARGTLAKDVEYPQERDIVEEDPRVGVFVCHCGSNIAGYLDVNKVTDYAAELPGVVHADHLLYACSQDSTAVIQESIAENELNRVVVASCTPLTHAPLFQDCLKRAGLNEHLLAMANIRNHCSWIHSENPKIATSKANDLVRMAVARAIGLEPLHKQPVPVEQSALVIGGGPAGMMAAVTLAEQGFPVHLIERSAVLGGSLRNTYFNTPGADSLEPQDHLAHLISRASENPLITCHLESELVKTTGFVGNFTSIIEPVSGDTIEIRHGITIVATGGQEYRGPEYGYGSHPRIFTQQELETILASESGMQTVSPPRELDLRAASQVVMIQCVGPAEEYCARTCCTSALKNALILKDMYPDLQVVVLYRDMRTYGFYERLYHEAREKGVIFLLYDEESRPIVERAEDGGIISIQLQDPILGQPLLLEPDLLVLSMPLVPSDGNRELASRLKVPVDQDGWFLEAHVKLRPVEFASDGIYLAGVAHYPKMLDEAIVQAQAAASRASTVLTNSERLAGGVIAQVDPAQCVACLTCVRVCPYDIPMVTQDAVGVGGIAGAAFIEPSICQGCGTCAAACPAEAIELLHYRHEQLEKQVFSLLELKEIDRTE
ncbi:MAG: FAD-dependent oxidoreductase [Anaerolineales bacterium]|nr:FAD-dependent oxidoreductase [Anaerolineales bacterium]